MSKRVVFISLPMNGYSDEYVRSNIKKAQTVYLAITGRKYSAVEFIDTMDNPPPPEGMDKNKYGVWYLGHSLIKLAQCDEAFFCFDWKKARGCMIEHEACSLYDIPTTSIEY